jgi:hypothetical protein
MTSARSLNRFPLSAFTPCTVIPLQEVRFVVGLSINALLSWSRIGLSSTLKTSRMRCSSIWQLCGAGTCQRQGNLDLWRRQISLISRLRFLRNKNIGQERWCTRERFPFLAQRYDLEVLGIWSWCLSAFSSGVPVCASLYFMW